jgi:putative heme-binding domain-containing protein
MILDPNHDIAAGYEGYTIETTDGGAFAGIIENETDNNIRLKGPGGVTQTILKSNVKSMSPMPVSLMPEGLEASINKEDMADLLEYIKTLR